MRKLHQGPCVLWRPCERSHGRMESSRVSNLEPSIAGWGWSCLTEKGHEPRDDLTCEQRDDPTKRGHNRRTESERARKYCAAAVQLSWEGHYDGISRRQFTRLQRKREYLRE